MQEQICLMRKSSNESSNSPLRPTQAVVHAHIALPKMGQAAEQEAHIQSQGDMTLFAIRKI